MARNHDARATRQGEDARSERSESKASTVAPFVTAIYNSIQPQFGCRASGTVRNPLTHYLRRAKWLFRDVMRPSLDSRLISAESALRSTQR